MHWHPRLHQFNDHTVKEKTCDLDRAACKATSQEDPSSNGAAHVVQTERLTTAITMFKEGILDGLDGGMW